MFSFLRRRQRTTSARDASHAAESQTDTSKPTGDYWLLSIGIDRYQHLPDLRTASAGARALAEVLVKHYGVTRKHTTVLLDQDATRVRIIAELRRLAEHARPNDSVVVYYAGHGQLDPLTEVGTWLPTDGDTKDMASWVSNDTINNLIRGMKARHVLLISDSCFAGSFFNTRDVGPRKPADFAAAHTKTSREAMTSGGMEPVPDAGLGCHSVYTHFLLLSLQENTKRCLLPFEMHSRIYDGMKANLRGVTPAYAPLFGSGGEPGGAFVFFRRDIQEPPKKAPSEHVVPTKMPPPDAEEQYLAALHTAFEDRRIVTEEREDLAELRGRLSLAQKAADRLERQVLGGQTLKELLKESRRRRKAEQRARQKRARAEARRERSESRRPDPIPPPARQPTRPRSQRDVVRDLLRPLLARWNNIERLAGISSGIIAILVMVCAGAAMAIGAWVGNHVPENGIPIGVGAGFASFLVMFLGLKAILLPDRAKQELRLFEDFDERFPPGSGRHQMALEELWEMAEEDHRAEAFRAALMAAIAANAPRAPSAESGATLVVILVVAIGFLIGLIQSCSG